MLQGPLPMIALGSSRLGAWEAEAALGGAKLFLIGSPYASDFCFSDIAGGPLQVQTAPDCVHRESQPFSTWFPGFLHPEGVLRPGH